MNVIIIGSKNPGSKNDPVFLGQNLQAEGIATRQIFWEDIVFDIATHSVAVKPEVFKDAKLAVAVNWYKSGEVKFYRDVAYALGLYLQKQAIPVWNSEMIRQRSTTKLSCLVQLALEGFPVPRTLFSLNGEALYRVIEAELTLPVVVKIAAGSRGHSNFLIKDAHKLQQLLMREPVNKFIVQPYLPNNHDIRIICFGGVPKLALKRMRSNAKTHLNNTSAGAEAQWLELNTLPEALLTDCRKICTLMGREMAGIDFIPDASSSYGYTCLEVNSIPQLTSGVGVDRKMTAFAQAVKEIDKEKS